MSDEVTFYEIEAIDLLTQDIKKLDVNNLIKLLKQHKARGGNLKDFAYATDTDRNLISVTIRTDKKIHMVKHEKVQEE